MSALEFLASTLRASGLELTEHPEQQAVSFGHRSEVGDWEVFCRIRSPYSQIVIYSIHPYATPEHTRGTMSELLTRANYGLVIGNFELDLEDGEVRFKTSLDFSGDRLSGALIAMLLQHNLEGFARYRPAVDAVMTGGTNLQLLLDRVEV